MPTEISGSTGVNKIQDGTVVNADIVSLAASKLTGALPAISGASLTGITTGKILQVVQTAVTASYTFSSTTSWQDLTGLNVSITPSATSSKILVTVHTNSAASSGENLYCHGRVLRDSTAIGIGDQYGSNAHRAGWAFSDSDGYTKTDTRSWAFLDSPSSTSSLTYKGQFYNQGSTTFRWNRTGEDNDDANSGRLISTITCMEIGA